MAFQQVSAQQQPNQQEKPQIQQPEQFVELVKSTIAAALLVLHFAGKPLLPTTCTIAIAAVQAPSLLEVLVAAPSKAKAKVAVATPSMAAAPPATSSIGTLGAAGFVLAVVFSKVLRILEIGASAFQSILLAYIVCALCYCCYHAVGTNMAHAGPRGGLTPASSDEPTLDHLLDPAVAQAKVEEDRKDDFAGTGATLCASPSLDGDFLGLSPGTGKH